jgi:hypothetical protein
LRRSTRPVAAFFELGWLDQLVVEALMISFSANARRIRGRVSRRCRSPSGTTLDKHSWRIERTTRSA